MEPLTRALRTTAETSPTADDEREGGRPNGADDDDFKTFLGYCFCEWFLCLFDLKFAFCVRACGFAGRLCCYRQLKERVGGVSDDGNNTNRTMKGRPERVLDEGGLVAEVVQNSLIQALELSLTATSSQES